MIILAKTFDRTSHHVVARATINHPHADEVSVRLEENFPHSVELAFFKNDNWVDYEMDELAQYRDGGDGMVVYRYVPLLDFAKFLDYYTKDEY